MDPVIKSLPTTKLVGMRMRMSLQNNLTPKLWGSFMPHRQKVEHVSSPWLYSLQNYPSHVDMNSFTPAVEFEKWAAVEVSEDDQIPENMERFTIPTGDYAVFIHKGLPQDFPKTFDLIFNQWLPQSEYQLDKRPHFERLPPNYRPDNPESEEEVWIPVSRK